MKSISLIGLFLIFFSSNIFAKEVELIINVPYITPQGENIYMTGNNPTLCEWKANCIRLKKISQTVWKTTLSIDESFEFKITRGTWRTEEVKSSGRRILNHKVNIQEVDGPVVLNIPHWKDLKPLSFSGTHKIIKDFYVPQLNNKKDIFIWLPPSYKNNNTKKYPVIYMHDGQNIFSPYTAAFGNEWSIDEVMSKLIKEGRVKEAIIVASSSDSFERSLEYHVYKKGRKYARFVADTLKSYIDKNYRTLPDRKNTYLMGSSFGALISFTILWENSEIFSKAAGLSFPAHAHENYVFDFIDEIPSPSKKIFFYLDHGLYGIDASYAPHGENWVTHLLNLGFPSEQLDFRTFQYANHTELDWAQRVHIPLMYLLN
ncbi:MAG: hypothetical protein KC493_12415 [Bacteriovoracaceae bacterium]|nr:hypothetical protein [Bacteriovoracaceae bacterium]